MRTNETTDRPVECWTCDRFAERLCGSIQEAVKEYVDRHLLPSEEIPETVTVYGYMRMEPDAGHYAELYLTWLLGSLDEEYGDPDAGVYTQPTEAMKVAARTCVAAVLGEYRVWTCERVMTETVRVRDYIDDADGDA